MGYIFQCITQGFPSFITVCMQVGFYTLTDWMGGGVLLVMQVEIDTWEETLQTAHMMLIQ